MPLPDNFADLTAFGYTFLNSGNCSSYQAPIQWWKTPKGKKMPMTVTPEGRIVSHFTDCPNANQHRRNR